MKDLEKNNQNNKSDENKDCYFCKPIEWIAYKAPTKLYKIVYSKKNLFFVLIIAVLVYLITFNQPEIVRKTLTTFVFAAGCWMLEVFPLPITGLMIPAMLTLLGVFNPKEAFAPFSNSIIFLMIGGLVLGQSIKKHGLDKWIGYNLLTYSKGKIDRLILLVMASTAFLSMWMSNTVAIAVILPVILSILTAMPEELVNLKRKMLLGVSISTSIGGTAMLTGSTPAMIAGALLGETLSFGFIEWAYYGLPVSLLVLALAFLLLKKLYPSPKVTLKLDAIIEQKKQIEKLNNTQKRVLLIFLGTIIFWFMGSQFEVWLGLPTSVSNVAIVSVIAVLIMFGFNLLDIKDLQSIQWELIFLVGGGILLGEAMIISGAASGISSAIASMHGSTPTIVIIIVLSTISLLLTNFISNSATAAILIPIAIETANILEMSPVPFVMAVALSATIAFITPVGVPSTALIYSTGLIPRSRLIKTGILAAIPALLTVLAVVWILPVP
ncbi:MAG: SLC13/DASS family transporter [Candidatus Bathyarchaeota archaeon]|nr:SLC13 family permease [Candidatus Bathyarchaeum tardum]WGM90134.1 MAG: SLC13 family permease [Candidatus Bathyarchaeum tardum]WNZ29732.1 MAG: SLC13/DASS family transporter [Candidatus Bathyarchaeota archaeon]